MDQSSKRPPFLTEKIESNRKQMNALMDEMYEFRDEQGVELMGSLLMAKRDEQMLELLKMKPSESTPVEIAYIKGKIDIVSDVISFINAEYYKRSKRTKEVKKEKTKRVTRRNPTDAGPAI